MNGSGFSLAELTDESDPQELHDSLVHTLGNLTLTAENAKLSNSPFQRKQDIFIASALQMNREIADAPSWGKARSCSGPIGWPARFKSGPDRRRWRRR